MLHRKCIVTLPPKTLSIIHIALPPPYPNPLPKYYYSKKSLKSFYDHTILHNPPGNRGRTVVKVLCYKSEGRWLDSRLRHWNFSLT